MKGWMGEWEEFGLERDGLETRGGNKEGRMDGGREWMGIAEMK